jgi:hypothetical protein
MLQNKIDITKEETLDFAAAIAESRDKGLDTVTLPFGLVEKVEAFLGKQFDHTATFDPESNTWK